MKTTPHVRPEPNTDIPRPEYVQIPVNYAMPTVAIIPVQRQENAWVRRQHVTERRVRVLAACWWASWMIISLSLFFGIIALSRSLWFKGAMTMQGAAIITLAALAVGVLGVVMVNKMKERL